MPTPFDRFFGGNRDQRAAKWKAHSAAQQGALKARRGATQSIDRRRIEPHIAGWAVSLRQQLAGYHHHREQYGIPVTGKKEPEPRRTQQLRDATSRIAPDIVNRGVMPRQQP